MASPVVHFEINCQDAAKMQAFYRELFDWKIEVGDQMEGYGLVEPEPPGIGGGVAQADANTPAGVLIYAGVDDLDATLRKVESMGGRTLVPITTVPDMVVFAVFADPEGHVIGIVKNE